MYYGKLHFGIPGIIQVIFEVKMKVNSTSRFAHFFFSSV